ncbi:MAG: WD40/YVTN/BNR-like repeat-containing protein [Candidatus Binatia bacterium]
MNRNRSHAWFPPSWLRRLLAASGFFAIFLFGAAAASALQLEPVAGDLRLTPHHKLHDAAFRGASGWIVGSLGTALHTADGGRSWTRAETGTTESLFSVAFADERAGWISGANGTLLRTTDGGRSWRRFPLETREHLFVVRFAAPARGLCAGSFGTVLETDDGGETWRPLVLDWSAYLGEFFEEKGAMQPHLYDVFFVDERRGWTTGEFGLVLATEDGGRTWAAQRSDTRRALYKAFFADPRRGWVVGQNGALLATEDGGATWAFSDLSRESFFNVAVGGDSGLIVGERGTVFGSRDAGRTWARLPDNPVGLSSWIQALSPAGERGFYLAGDRGALFRLRWQ